MRESLHKVEIRMEDKKRCSFVSLRINDERKRRTEYMRKGQE